MQERGLEARHVLLMESVWKADPLTGIRERMDKCTCSACGAVRYEWRGEYENRTMTGCDACGAHCMAVRKRNGKLPYEADGSLLWFHRHKDTAVAQGYEVNYWVGNDAVEHWAAVPPTFTLGDPMEIMPLTAISRGAWDVSAHIWTNGMRRRGCWTIGLSAGCLY